MVPEDLTFERWTADRPSVDGMAAFLGDLRGRRILEYGCGLGELSIVLARSGARVTTFDLSEASVDFARRRADMNGVADRIEFHVASGEELPFEDGAFELAVGKAILHHLDPVVGSRELDRVLAPGGRATFSEPLGTNPLLVLARAHLPYPGKHERGADRPLTRADIAAWQEPFAEFRLRPVQLLSMVERALGFGRRVSVLRRADDVLLARAPSLWRLCRYAVLFMAKPTAGSRARAEQLGQVA
jgi:SAM-dependent methyltransferase